MICLIDSHVRLSATGRRPALSKIVDPVPLARLHDVVIDGEHVRTGIFIFYRDACYLPWGTPADGMDRIYSGGLELVSALWRSSSAKGITSTASAKGSQEQSTSNSIVRAKSVS